MSNTQTTPWKRLPVEVAAIVASILLAFAIDAWWEEAKDGRRERAHLLSLHKEFSENLELLHEITLKNEVTKDAANVLLGVVTERRERPPAAELVGATWTAFSVARFEPLTTSYQNLISTGDIALIRDEQLKFDIALFITASELYRHQESTLEQWQGPIQQFIGREMVPLDWVPEDSRAVYGLPAAAGATDWDNVLESREFEGILVNRVIAVQDNLGRLADILSTAERIVLRLEVLIGTE